MFKRLLKKIIPGWVLRLYHRAFAIVTPLFYGNPGKRLIIIGVTGTNGKSTTVAMIGEILKAHGHRTAWMSTATERIGDFETPNSRKMTMPGHGELQRFLRRALADRCTHAVIEVSSQGVAQYRDLGIPFDVAVFLNLTPEHIEAHGSFLAYMVSKLNFFRHLSSRRVHKFGKLQDRSIVLNIDDKYGLEFFSVGVEKYFACSQRIKDFQGFNKVFFAHDIEDNHQGAIDFAVEDQKFTLPMFGIFNVDNALAAIAACYAVGVPVEAAAKALASFNGIPGRLEFIQKQPFGVVIDYAPEPASMAALYSVVGNLSHARIIHVFGSAGGGRDVSRRPVLGSYVGQHADIAIITNEDPYDEDPRKIIDQVAEGARSQSRMEEGTSLFCIEDRREAIRFALAQARPRDLVLITGKANEQWIMGANGRKIPWDDRKIAKDLLGITPQSTGFPQ